MAQRAGSRIIKESRHINRRKFYLIESHARSENDDVSNTETWWYKGHAGAFLPAHTNGNSDSKSEPRTGCPSTLTKFFDNVAK